MAIQKLTHRILFDWKARLRIFFGHEVIIDDTLKVDDQTGQIARLFAIRVDGDNRKSHGRHTVTAEQEGGGQQQIPNEISGN